MHCTLAQAPPSSFAPNGTDLRLEKGLRVPCTGTHGVDEEGGNVYNVSTNEQLNYVPSF